MSGCSRTFPAERLEELAYRDVAAGDLFGDLAAIDGRSRSADVDALDDTLLASMSPATFRGCCTNGSSLRPTQSDIASRVATYGEQVTRKLSALVKQGLVERGDHALIIADVARLEQIVAEVR